MLYYLVLLTSIAAESLDHDLQYVAELRSLQFFQLADVQADRLLSQVDLAPLDRSRVVVEVSKTFAARALNARPPERDAFWLRATEVLAEESQRQTDLGIAMILRSQQAFVDQQQSAWSVREAEIRAQADEDWSDTRSLLRHAIRSLRQVEEALASPDFRRQQTLPEAQVRALQRNLQLQLGYAYLHQAITYRGNRRDQTNALTQAMSYFQPLAAGRTLDEVTWKSRIQQVHCLRLLGQLAEAQTLLQTWSSSAPTSQLGAIAAEGIRLALDARQTEVALQLANTPSLQTRDPEFQLARIEALVAASGQLKGQPRAKAFQQQATLAAAELGKQHGTYWALRGELLLLRLALEEDADAKMLSTAAETLLRKDAPESAKQMFLKAAEQAGEPSGANDSRAFEFYYKAAVIDHREGKLQSAIDQFQRVARQYPAHAQAAEAHLLAVFDAAALYQQYATQDTSKLGDALRQYEELLQEHLEYWPDGDTADQARIWSAKLALAQRRWQAAIDLYHAVQVGSKFEVQAYRGLGMALGKWIAAIKPEKGAIQSQQAWMDARLQAVQAEPARRVLVLEAARFASKQTGDYVRAATLLQQQWQAVSLAHDSSNGESSVSESSDGVSASDVGSLLVIAASGAGRADVARRVLAEIVPLPPETLLQLLGGLEPIRWERPEDKELRAMTLEMIELVRPYERQLGENDRLLLRRAMADSLPAEDAVAEYRELVEQSPNDLGVRTRYARLLTKRSDPESRQLALQQWRRVAQLAEKQTLAWFQAKLAVADAHYRLGDRQETRDLIVYLSALYPDLGSPVLKVEFERLLRQAGGAE